ncbi:MAG: hypothetical protein CL916_03635 [Deltaproteobacteria bacterium]|nr:hypothetical protein [Deltaproteobacteria bacterium]
MTTKMLNQFTSQLKFEYTKRQQRVEFDKLFHTFEDFERCGSPKRVLFLGCTGAGKSTVCNVISGNRGINTPSGIQWDKKLIFESSHGTKSITRHVSYANLRYLNDLNRKITVIDTPGHDDTSHNSAANDENAHDCLRQQAADLHNKLRALGSIDLIVILHDKIQSNRLNPATFELLKLINEKFNNQPVWNNVVIAYSHCNRYCTSTWDIELDQKKAALQREIIESDLGCDVELPVITLGGICESHDETMDDFEELWNLIEKSSPISTRDLQPFTGAAWCKYESAIKARDEALTRQDAAINLFPVVFQLITCICVLLWRDALPMSISMMMLNIPHTYFDELIIVMTLVNIIGPQKVSCCVDILFETYLKPLFYSLKQKYM